MVFEIDNDIKGLATLCKSNLACLESDCHTICIVKDCINGKVHFIECKDQNFCTYKKSFGHNHICTCPVRKEIYNKYKI
jgi:hypothetical protein